MRKGLIVVTAITFATVGFASRNTSAGQSVADRFAQFKEAAKDKAKEKGRELFDREKQGKEKLKDVASEAAGKLIDRYMGGGDKEPAKAVADSIIHKAPWYKAALKIFFTPSETGESDFTDPMQTVTEQPVVPANPSNDTPMTITHVHTTPVVSANPSNDNASTKAPQQKSSASPETTTLAGHEGGGFVGSQHDQPFSQGTSATSASAPMHLGQQELRAGETTFVQAHPGEVVFHPNPEMATGNNTAQPAASAPVASHAPERAAAPAPSVAPPAIQHDHDPTGHGGGNEGGGHQGGGWAGADHGTAGNIG